MAEKRRLDHLSRAIASDRSVRRGQDRGVLRGSHHFRYTPRRLDRAADIGPEWWRLNRDFLELNNGEPVYLDD